MTKDAKNAISHRYRALNSLRTWLTENADSFTDEIAQANAKKAKSSA